MSNVLVGSAYGVLELRNQQFDQGVQASLAQLAKLRDEFAKGIPPLTIPSVGGSLPGGGSPAAPRQLPGSQAANIQKDEAAMLRYANSLAMAQKAQGDLNGAAETYRTVLAQITPGTIEANSATARLAQTEAQLARETQQSAGFTQQFGDSLKSSFMSVLGPAALAATAIGGFRKALDVTEESFKLKAAIDQTNASITVQLQSFRDVGRVQLEASAFADRYKLTQQETQESIQTSIPILRQSKQSLTDVESTLLRLSVLKSEQGISGAAFALAELQGGQTRSLETRFNIPIAKANELKQAIADGGDAVVVLGKYLDSVGVGMDALATRTKGATGKMNELKVETEKFELALGGQAGGPGEAILDARIAATRGATRAMSGDWVAFGKSVVDSTAEGQGGMLSFLNVLSPLAKLVQSLPGYAQLQGKADQERSAATAALAASSVQLVAAFDDVRTRTALLTQQAQLTTAAFDDERRAAGALQAVTGQASSDIQRSAGASLLDAANKQRQAGATELLKQQTQGAVSAFLQLNPGIDAAGIAAQIAAGKLPALIGQLAAVQQQTYATNAALLQFSLAQGALGGTGSARALGGGPTLGAAGLGGGAGAVGSQVFGRANQLQAARDQLALAQAKTSAERIAIYRRQLADTADAAERLRIEAQIASEEQTRVKGATSTATKLNDIALTSGIDRAKIERENLERLADQEQDFNLRRTRSQEDYERQRRKLLADGKVFEARQLKETFDREQQRAAEDFAISRQRTIRNNAESLGDQGARVGVQVAKATRGKGGTLPDLGGNAAPTIGGDGGAATAAPTRIIQIQLIGGVTLDGQKVGDLIYPHLQPQIAEDILIDIQSAGAPGSRQSAVAGARP